jgi:hypothetical protein
MASRAVLSSTELVSSINPVFLQVSIPYIHHNNLQICIFTLLKNKLNATRITEVILCKQDIQRLLSFNTRNPVEWYTVTIVLVEPANSIFSPTYGSSTFLRNAGT